MRFEILGPTRVLDDGNPVSIGSPQQQKLLALLLTFPNTPVSTDRLINELWGDHPPASARHLIHVYVSRLRTLLGRVDGRPRIETVGASYAIQVRPDELDSLDLQARAARANELLRDDPATAAEILSGATALWRGTPFGDLAPESNTLMSEVALLTEIYLGAVCDRIDAELDLGRHERLVGELERLTDEYPYRERFWEQLMLALYRSSRQVEALRAFQSVRAILATDLGIEPGPALDRLEMQILLHDPAILFDEPKPPTNLPVRLTSFVGRRSEIDEVAALLADHRAVTLTGPGGIGKTRLALAVAGEVLARFTDGVWWLDLARLDDTDELVPTVARTLNVIPQPGSPLVESVARSLTRKRALFVLDNCEHVAAGAAEVVRSILGAAPEVRILATSRTPLHTAAERVWAVPPLGMTGVEEPGRAIRSDAIRLFEDRGLAVDRNFAITEENAGVILDICARVDGIPLAIEMAAARVRVLTPAQILSSLTDPFVVLTRADRDGEDRHRTLHAALDWSYELLEPDIRSSFDRMSVFVGDFDVEAAESVAFQDRPTVSALDAITALVDDSMMSVSGEKDQVVRYRLLATVREYGRLHLEARGQVEQTREAHARYFLDFVARSRGAIDTPAFGAWVTRISDRYGDVRVGLDWALSNQPRAEAMLTADVLFQFWFRSGDPREAALWGRRMLENTEGVPSRFVAAARQSVGFGATILGDPTESQHQLDQAVRLFRRSEDPDGLALALFGRGNAALQVGDYAKTRRCAEEALGISDQSEKPWMRAGPLTLLSFADLFAGGPLERARSLAEEAQTLYRELGDVASQVVMNPLSVIALRQGDITGAERCALDAAAVASGTGWEATALVNLAEVYLAQEKTDLAQRTLETGLVRALDSGLENWFRIALRDLASAAVQRGETDLAALLLGASKRNMPKYGLDPSFCGPIEDRCRDDLGSRRYGEITNHGYAMERAAIIAHVLDDVPAAS